jgi:cytoskeletal protein RodZ
MKTPKSLVALALALTCVAAAAQWQWIDSEGRKVFSDRGPPPDIPDKNIVKRPPGRLTSTPAVVEPADGTATPTLPAAAPKAAEADKDLEAKKKQAAEAEAAKKKAETEQITKVKVENCARAKQAKATLDSGARIGRVNASGEREIMDDTARAAEAKRIQAVMASDCN